MNLTISQVWKSFSNVTVVSDVSLVIGEGELFYLLGPSGCGKTTLLRMVAGFLTPDRGRIQIGATDVTSLPAQRRDTAMVFQNYALWPHMTVADNVAFGLLVRKVPRGERHRRVMEALECVRMEGFERRRPHQLSGGQQQRVALARALVVRPGVLLLDEPLSSLDARLRLEMRSEIRRICTELKLTTLCVTHDQKEALAVADRMAVMTDGCLRQIGSPDDLYEQPEHSKIASFLGECNIVKARQVSAGNGLVQFETPIGRIAARESVEGSGGEESGGETLLLSIRPESITLGRTDANAENCFEGRIVQRIYQGESVLFQLDVGSERMQVTLSPELARSAGLSEGKMTCYIDPHYVHVMKE